MDKLSLVICTVFGQRNFSDERNNEANDFFINCRQMAEREREREREGESVCVCVCVFGVFIRHKCLGF